MASCTKFLRLGIIAFVFGVILFWGAREDSYASEPQNPPSNHCVCKHNALQKKDVANFGASALIQWKKVNLFTGRFSYHRVVTNLKNPWRFVEFGWTKDIQGLCGAVAVNNNCGMIVYDAGAGSIRQPVAITRANHTYSFQYDPNTTKYWFFLDGANVWKVNAGFGQGDRVSGGGEVGHGVEQMKDVQLSNLLYLVQNGGIFQFVAWNGYVNLLQEAPYSNVAGGANDFFDHGP